VAEKIKTVEGYIASCPRDVQHILTEIRRTIGTAAPGSGETMSYQMPTVMVDGKPLMYFAAWKKHIGIYPIPALDDSLEQQVSRYRSGKDSVNFPLREPIPYALIGQLVTDLLRRRAEDDRLARRPD
jgi:uncharacterized protein YdhG (YjbR/CyaY superfamily)